MDKKDLRPLAVHTSSFLFSPTGKTISLSVNDTRNIDTEIFAHLEYLSEIQTNGVKRIKGIKAKNASVKNWKTFRSFVRQAKLYYFSALNQHPSVSSLNFFYAFENLVKAYCCLHHPEKFNNKIQHGLGTGKTFSDDFNQEITLQKEGVMPIFYELLTGRKITASTKVLNNNLISYCSDVAYENSLSNSGSFPRGLLMKAVLGGLSQEKISLVVGIVASGHVLKNKDIAKIIEDHFNLVDLPQKTAEESLKIPLDEYRFYNFFQTKDDFKLVPTEWVSKDFYNKFFPFVTFYPRNMDGGGFRINLPTTDTAGKEIIMNECLAIFILMFYMSELVRYHPKTIQDNLSKPSGWLMERFVANTPQTFLRYMVNLIRGEDFIFI